MKTVFETIVQDASLEIVGGKLRLTQKLIDCVKTFDDAGRLIDVQVSRPRQKSSEQT